jgi:glycosyltransferase involved in cell wall biosynthesis
MCERADLVFTTSHALWQRKRLLNPETHLALHGVDWAHFATALASDLAPAPELSDLTSPVLGFFGLVHDWIDLALLEYIAAQRPTWTLVIIGKVAVDVTRLRRFANIRWLGRRAYDELPRYCKGFSLGLIPFVVNELTRNVNPIKLREYASAGLPVVSTRLPECERYPSWCRVADDPAQFLAACEAALAEDSAALRRQRSQQMRAESWESKVRQLGEAVLRVRSGRSRAVG